MRSVLDVHGNTDQFFLDGKLVPSERVLITFLYFVGTSAYLFRAKVSRRMGIIRLIALRTCILQMQSLMKRKIDAARIHFHLAIHCINIVNSYVKMNYC